MSQEKNKWFVLSTIQKSLLIGFGVVIVIFILTWIYYFNFYPDNPFILEFFFGFFGIIGLVGIPIWLVAVNVSAFGFWIWEMRLRGLHLNKNTGVQLMLIMIGTLLTSGGIVLLLSFLYIAMMLIVSGLHYGEFSR